jgi:radical SAM protein with 4Fe4S-binding SPASM domain
VRATIRLSRGHNHASADVDGFDEPFEINSQIYYLPYNKELLIVYAPYEGFACLIDKKEYSFLTSNRYVDSVPAGLSIFYKRAIKSSSSPHPISKANVPSPAELTILLGDSCNLRCSYCGITDYISKQYSAKKTVDGVKTLLAQYPSIKSISFFSNGEPTLYINAVKEIVEFAKGIGIEAFSITTNAVYGGRKESVVRFLMENNFGLQISLDGTERIHNEQRPSSGNANSYREVLETIKEISKYRDINDGITYRFTLTLAALDEMPQIIRSFHAIGIREVRFADLVLEGRALDFWDHFTEHRTINEIVRIISDAYLLADELGMSLTGDFDPRRPTDLDGYSCAYTAGSAISVTSKLDVLACIEDREEWRVGKVLPQLGHIQYNDAKLNWIRGRYAGKFEACTKCPVKCGGGCAHNSFLKYGNLDNNGDYPEKCQILRGVLARYLAKRLEFEMRCPPPSIHGCNLNQKLSESLARVESPEPFRN